MAVIYVGPTRKDLDLLNNRIYREKPVELIEQLKAIGVSLAGNLFVKPNEKVDSVIVQEAYKQLRNIKGVE